MRVNRVLDREKISKYNLTIVATDSGIPARKSVAFLIIHVNDVNDHEPIFEKSEYSAVLSESVPIGSYVAGITATDQDTGINSNIFYAIVSGNDNTWFDIDTTSGLITTRNQLDRELEDTVELRISARDGGPNPRWAYTHIKIHILDENDERPVFVVNRSGTGGGGGGGGGGETVNLSENTSPNTVVATLTAVDHDQGTNGSISYMFDSEMDQRYPGIFAIDSTTGRVTTKTKLDREVMPEYEIRVVARDHGNPPLSSTAVVVLRVVDANDNSPEFYPQQYLVTLTETAPIGTAVVQVTATDQDELHNAQVTYSIKSEGAEGGIFDIEEETGVIRLRASISNGNAAAHYKLRVTAKDKGDRKAVEDAVVEILIESASRAVNYLEFAYEAGGVEGDGNGNDPKDYYEFSISEDAGKKEPAIGREIGRVQLQNHKQLQSAAKYSIVDGDQLGAFNIDENTGVLTTAKRIDREIKSHYQLTVVARSGSSSYGKTAVNITIIDVNDNSPVFVKNGLNWPLLRAVAHVAENAPAGKEVFLAKAEDADEESNSNSAITYELTVNPNDVFSISATTGMIYLKRPLRQQLELKGNNNKNNNNNNVMSLEVKATDRGSPPLSSRLLVTLLVDDVNDHTPVFEYSSYETSLLETVAGKFKVPNPLQFPF